MRDILNKFFASFRKSLILLGLGSNSLEQALATLLIGLWLLIVGFCRLGGFLAMSAKEILVLVNALIESCT